MTELFAGLSLGLGAGISPGPLLTLVVTSTLDRGFGAGVRVAVAPLLTDAPIIALTVAVVSSVSDGLLRGLGVAGGIVVVMTGAWTLVTAQRRTDAATDAQPGAADVVRGVLVNAFSPHPWIFWIGVGAPLLVAAWRDSPGLGGAFLVGFYALLVGSKVAIAWLVASSRHRLSDRLRERLVRTGGLLLVLGGLLLIWEAGSGRL